MSLAQIRNRIKKAQRNTNAGEALGIVAAAISRKAYYDEMTEEEKTLIVLISEATGKQWKQ